MHVTIRITPAPSSFPLFFSFDFSGKQALTHTNAMPKARKAMFFRLPNKKTGMETGGTWLPSFGDGSA
jgi:hypothetical protein